MRWVNVFRPARNSVCLVLAVSLAFPPGAFAGGQNHLRSTQVQDDPKNNPTLAGLEQELRRAAQPVPVSRNNAEQPVSPAGKTLWGLRGQVWVPSTPTPSVSAGMEEFVIGGVNTNAAIDRLSEITGLPIARIEARARPTQKTASTVGPDGFGGSITGFISLDENFKEVLKRDNTAVLSMGLTHQQLAAPLLRAINTSNGNQQFMVNGKMFSVGYQGYLSYQESLFNDGLRAQGDFTVTDDETGRSIKFSLLVPHYINAYGFYEGNVPNRIEPQSIIDLFGLASGQPIQGPLFDRVEFESIGDLARPGMRTLEGQEIIGIPPFQRDQRGDLSSNARLPGGASFELLIPKEYAPPYQGERRGIRLILGNHPAGKGPVGREGEVLFENVERIQFDPETGILRITHFKGREERLESHADGRPKLVHFNSSDAALVVAVIYPDGGQDVAPSSRVTTAGPALAGVEERPSELGEIIRADAPGMSELFRQLTAEFLAVQKDQAEGYLSNRFENVIRIARQIKPSFSIVRPDRQLSWDEQQAGLQMELTHQIFLPAGYMVDTSLNDQGEIEFTQWDVREETWRPHDYLGVKSAIWTADFRQVEGPARSSGANGLQFGHFAFSDPEAMRQDAIRFEYPKIMKAAHMTTMKLKSLLNEARIEKEAFGLYFGEWEVRHEEFRHAQDAFFAEQRYRQGSHIHRDFDLHAKKAEALLKPEAPLRSLSENYRNWDPSFWGGSVVEYVGRVGALMSEMDAHLELARRDPTYPGAILAYARFLSALVMRDLNDVALYSKKEKSLTPPVAAAQYMWSELASGGIEPSPSGLISYIEMDTEPGNHLAHAQRARSLLQSIYDQDSWWSEEERKQAPALASAGMEEERTLYGVGEAYGFFMSSRRGSLEARLGAFEKAIRTLTYRQLLALYRDFSSRFDELRRVRGELEKGRVGDYYKTLYGIRSNAEDQRDLAALLEVMMKRLRSNAWDGTEGVEGILHRLVRLASQKERPVQERREQARSWLAALEPAETSELLDLYDRHPLNEYGAYKGNSDLPIAQLIREELKPRSWIRKIADRLRLSVKSWLARTLPEGELLRAPHKIGMFLFFIPVLLSTLLSLPAFFLSGIIMDSESPQFLANLFGGNPRDRHLVETAIFISAVWLSVTGGYALSLLSIVSGVFSPEEKKSQFTFPEYWEKTSKRRWIGIGKRKGGETKQAGDLEAREERVILKSDFVDTTAGLIAEGSFLPRPDIEYHLAQSFQRWAERFPKSAGSQYPLDEEILLKVEERRERRLDTPAPVVVGGEGPDAISDFMVRLNRALYQRKKPRPSPGKEGVPERISVEGQTTPISKWIPKGLNLGGLTKEQLELLAQEVADYLRLTLSDEVPEGSTRKLNDAELEKERKRVREIYEWVRAQNSEKAAEMLRQKEEMLRQQEEKSRETEAVSKPAPEEPRQKQATFLTGFDLVTEYDLQQWIAGHYLQDPSYEDVGSKLRFEADGKKYAASLAMRAAIRIGDRDVPVFLIQDTRDESGKQVLGDSGGYWNRAGIFIVIPALLSQINDTLFRLRYLAGSVRTPAQAVLAKAYPEAEKGDEAGLRQAVVRDALEWVVLHEAQHALAGAQGLRPASGVVSERLAYLSSVLFASNPAAQLFRLLDGTPEGDHGTAGTEIKESLGTLSASGKPSEDEEALWLLVAERPLWEMLSVLGRLYEDSSPPAEGQAILSAVRRFLNREQMPEVRMEAEAVSAPIPVESFEEVGLRMLLNYVAQPDVSDTLALLAESGKTGDVTSDFPALWDLVRDAGYEGIAEIMRTVGEGEAVVGVPAEYAEGIPVWVDPRWRDEVEKNLARLKDAGSIRFVPQKDQAFLVIGDLRTHLGQVLLRISDQTVSQVTEHLLQGLQVGGRLKAGTVILLYELSKESVLVFA